MTITAIATDDDGDRPSALVNMVGNCEQDLRSALGQMSDYANALDQLSFVEAVARGPLEMRAAAETVEVRPSERLVTIVAVPYDTPTPIYTRGEWITETVAPSAFVGVEHRARQVKVNRGHDVDRSVGVARRLDPYDERGLIATLRISPTPLGDETLALCEDGVLDASVGFAPIGPEGEQWLDHRQARRVTHAYLGHIALVPNPAYDTANVIDVRAAAYAADAAAGAQVMAGAMQPLPESDTPRLRDALARLAEIGYVPRPVAPN